MAERLATALRRELQALLAATEPVGRDHDIIKLGDRLETSLAASICQSVCMIILYTPTTFEDDHPWCAREYAAMLELEQERLKNLDGIAKPARGPILPIVFRGEKRLPPDLRQRRPYPLASVIGDLNTSPEFAMTLPTIAECIGEWCDLFYHQKIAAGSNGCCEGFQLPTANDTRVGEILLAARSARPTFPGKMNGPAGGYPD